MNRYPTHDRLVGAETGTRELYWQDLIMAMEIPGSVFERCLIWVIHVSFAVSRICSVIGPLRTWWFALEVVGPDVIQVPKRELRIMRYEPSDREWAVIEPKFPN